MDPATITTIVETLLNLVLDLVDRGEAKATLDRLAIVRANAAFNAEEKVLYPDGK